MRRLVKQTCSRFVFAHKSLEILKDNFCCSSLPDAKTLQRCSGENSESCRGPQEIAIFTRKIIFHRSIPVSYPYMFCGRWMFNLVLPTCQWNLPLFKDIFPYVSPSFSTGVSPIPTSLHPKKRSPPIIRRTEAAPESENAADKPAERGKRPRRWWEIPRT